MNKDLGALLDSLALRIKERYPHDYDESEQIIKRIGMSHSTKTNAAMALDLQSQAGISKPRNFTATTSGVKITLAWDAPVDTSLIDGYQITHEGSELMPCADVLTFEHDNLIAGSTHTYTIVACGPGGNLSEPVTVSATLDNIPETVPTIEIVGAVNGVAQSGTVTIRLVGGLGGTVHEYHVATTPQVSDGTLRRDIADSPGVGEAREYTFTDVTNGGLRYGRVYLWPNTNYDPAERYFVDFEYTAHQATVTQTTGDYGPPIGCDVNYAANTGYELMPADFPNITSFETGRYSHELAIPFDAYLTTLDSVIYYRRQDPTYKGYTGPDGRGGTTRISIFRAVDGLPVGNAIGETYEYVADAAQWNNEAEFLAEYPGARFVPFDPLPNYHGTNGYFRMQFTSPVSLTHLDHYCLVINAPRNASTGWSSPNFVRSRGGGDMAAGWLDNKGYTVKSRIIGGAWGNTTRIPIYEFQGSGPGGIKAQGQPYVNLSSTTHSSGADDRHFNLTPSTPVRLEWSNPRDFKKLGKVVVVGAAENSGGNMIIKIDGTTVATKPVSEFPSISGSRASDAADIGEDSRAVEFTFSPVTVDGPTTVEVEVTGSANVELAHGRMWTDTTRTFLREDGFSGSPSVRYYGDGVEDNVDYCITLHIPLDGNPHYYEDTIN